MFTLNIECSKDIEKLSINFADGTSTVTEVQAPKPKVKKVPPKQTKPKVEHNPIDIGENSGSGDVMLDLDADYSVSKEVVEKPNVKKERTVKVSEDMQNAEF